MLLLWRIHNRGVFIHIWSWSWTHWQTTHLTAEHSFCNLSQAWAPLQLRHKPALKRWLMRKTHKLLLWHTRPMHLRSTKPSNLNLQQVKTAAAVHCSKAKHLTLLAAAPCLQARKCLAKVGVLLTPKKGNFFFSQEALSGLGPQCFFYACLRFSKSRAHPRGRQTKSLRNQSRNLRWLARCVC